MSAPAQVNADEDFEVTLKVYGAFGNVATSYAGTVAFSSSDGSLVSTYTFSGAGVAVFTALDDVMSLSDSTSLFVV
jgi:hypothetical protein